MEQQQQKHKWNQKQPAQTTIHHYCTQWDLQSWLKMQRQQANPTQPSNIQLTKANPHSQPTLNNLPDNTQTQNQSTSPSSKPHLSTIHQTTLTPPEQTNEHWGDQPIHTLQTFTLVMNNVNTILATDGFTQWKATAHAVDQLHADLLCLRTQHQLASKSNYSSSSDTKEIILPVKSLNLIKFRQ